MQLRLLLVLLLSLSCAPQPAGGRADSLIVPGQRIGSYVVGESTRESLIGADTPENRRAYASHGVTFEFDQGQELIGVTVSNPDFATAGGVRVGSRLEEMFGEFGSQEVKPFESDSGKISFPMVQYPGIQFFVQDKSVVAIRVAKP